MGGLPTRPDSVRQPTLQPGSGSQFFSDAVINNPGQFFATPTVTKNGVTLQTRPGNLGRNTFRTHRFSNVDFSLIKDTHITERTSLEFRAEFFNLFNQHAFMQPASTVYGGGFGVAGATVLPERQIQFSLKLLF